MKSIKIRFHSRFGSLNKQLILNILSREYTVLDVYDEYDYFFAMETIYMDYEAFQEVIDSDPNAIRVFWAGEAVYGDLNLFDYVITQNSYLSENDRIIYKPFASLLIGSCFRKGVSELDLSKTSDMAAVILKEKSKFCNFMYSNPNAHRTRDELFYALSKYKKVDSLGKHLKNVEIEDTRNETDWKQISINIKKDYKFSIAAENAVFPGYTSEKIITSMMANTIPIYFGSDTVKDLYNSKSFINVSDFRSIDDLVKYVEEVDKNDDLYIEIMKQPWRTSEQINKLEQDDKKFLTSFLSIFNNDNIDKVRRRPRGTWPDMIYVDFFRGDQSKSIRKALQDLINILFLRIKRRKE